MAVNWGGAAGGAASGAQIGTTIMPGWGTAIGAIAGGIGGAFTGDGQAATPSYNQFLQNPQYQNTGATMNSMWDYIGNGMQNLSEGRAPTWFQQWAPQEEYQRKNALTGTYYGSGMGAQGGNQFGPGVLASQTAADVKAGRRGAGAGSNTGKQLQAYATGMSDIDRYLSQLGAQSMQQEQQSLFGAASSLSQGPQGQWAQTAGTPYQPGAMDSIMGSVGKIAGASGGLGGMFSGMFGGGGGGTGMSTMSGGSANGDYFSNMFQQQNPGYGNVLNSIAIK